MTPEEQHELEYLRFFFRKCDFGPAHEDVVDIINGKYKRETGKELPVCYRDEQDDDN